MLARQIISHSFARAHPAFRSLCFHTITSARPVTPLSTAFTPNPIATPLESAFTKNTGGVPPSLHPIRDIRLHSLEENQPPQEDNPDANRRCRHRRSRRLPRSSH